MPNGILGFMAGQGGANAALASGAATAGTGLATGGMSFLLPLLMSLAGGGLSSLFTGDSPQEKALMGVGKDIDANMGWLKSTPYSKGEINTISTQMGQQLTGAADVAAGRLGSAIGEADIPGGQPYGEYYMQALAPTIASGQAGAVDIKKQMMQFFAGMDEETKKNFLSAMGIKAGVGTNLPGTTNVQEGYLSSIGGTDMFAKIFGSLAKAYRDFNYQPIGQGGT